MKENEREYDRMSKSENVIQMNEDASENEEK